MLKPIQISNFLKERHETQAEKISIYWVETDGSRKEFCDEIQKGLGGLPILLAHVNAGEFQDANGIFDDVSQLIERHSSWFTDQYRTEIVSHNRFAILLVSKRPLSVPQLSSPVSLPDWFPAWPSTLLTVKIQSISYLVNVSIGDTSIPMASLGDALFALEQALHERLNWVLKHKPTVAHELWGKISADGGASGTLERQISDAASALQEVSTPSKFRPGGGKESPFIVSRLFRLWWKTSVNDLHDLSTKLAKALHIDTVESVPRQYSLAALLARTAQPSLANTHSGVTFSRNLLVSIANAIQFSNAAAHASDYPNFPAILSVSYVQDTAHSCQQAAVSLNAISDA